MYLENIKCLQVFVEQDILIVLIKKLPKRQY